MELMQSLYSWVVVISLYLFIPTLSSVCYLFFPSFS